MMPPHLLATLFVEPIPIGRPWRLLMLIPLALAVAVVYKTIRCRDVRDVPVASAVLCVTLVLGMFAVGVALLLAFQCLA